MTSKDYYRQLALYDLGFPMDEDYMKLHMFVTISFMNVSKYVDNQFYKPIGNSIIYYINDNKFVPIFRLDTPEYKISIDRNNIINPLGGLFPQLSSGEILRLILPIIINYFNLPEHTKIKLSVI